MRSIAKEQRLAAHLTEILDDYLPDDWRTEDLTQYALTQSTSLMLAAHTLREIGMENVKPVRRNNVGADDLSGNRRTAITDSGRIYRELPEDRDPIPYPGDTEWDRLAREHRMKTRSASTQEGLDNSLIRPVPFPPR